MSARTITAQTGSALLYLAVGLALAAGIVAFSLVTETYIGF